MSAATKAMLKNKGIVSILIRLKVQHPEMQKKKKNHYWLSTPCCYSYSDESD
jgi:hypothetical protein